MVWVRKGPVGGQPYYGTGAIAVTCPICDASVNTQCVVWRIESGERERILRTMRRPHAERIRLWKELQKK